MELEAAEKLAKDRMKFWLDDSWTFQFNNRKRAMGMCDEAKKVIYLSKTFTLGRSHEEVLNTILHEIAHALAGCKNGHNSVWKAACMRVGARPEAKCDVNMTPEQLGAKWVCVDGSGNVVKSWFRKPRQSTFDKIAFSWVPGRKEETLGKLTIIPFGE